MVQNTLYFHFTHQSQDSDWFDRLHYIYQHFQDSEKMHQLDPETETPVLDDDSYYLDSQIKDDFQCDHDCYSHQC